MKRTICLLICLMLILGLGTVATANPISPTSMSVTVSTWTEVQTAIATAGGDLEITLADDFTADGTITISNGHTITIISADENNIHTITSAPGLRHFHITNGTLILEHIVLYGNDNGGGVSLDGVAEFTRHLHLGVHSFITDCRALEGGAVNAMNGSTVVIEGGILSGNIASAGTGGGLRIANSSLTFIDGIIESNSATGISDNDSGGGGIFLNNAGNVQMQGGTIRDNTSQFNGGGVHISGNTIFTMSGGQITENHSLTPGDQGGGGVNVLGAQATFILQDNALIADNNALGRGGGIRIHNANLIMDGGIVRDNTADTGGGISVQGPRTSVINDGVIADNTATDGGGIRISNNATLDITGGTIRDNTAANNGGGIWAPRLPANGTAHINMSGGTITENTAANDGGGIWLARYNPTGTPTSGAWLDMTGGAITNNEAVSGDGGGIFTENHNYVDPVPFDTAYTNIIAADGTFSGNTAGGGLFMPPSNAADVPFGNLLTNYNINYMGSVLAAEITFILNGGNVGGDTANIVHLLPLDEAIGAENVPAPIRNNHTFSGWQELDHDGNPTGPVFTAAEVAVLEVTGSRTFEARWTPTLPGNGNGGGPGNGNGNGAFSPYHNAFLIGRPDGNIYPHDNITRAEVAAVFFRLLSDETRIAQWIQTNPFPDVVSEDWFNNVVSTVANIGVIYGMPDGTYAPNRPITRAEVAAIVARFFDDTGTDGIDFTDIAGHWGEDYIRQLSHLGWVRGYLDGTFQPDAPITRAEFTAIITRMLDRIPDSLDALLDGRTLWPDKSDTSEWYYLYMQEASHSTEFVRLPNGNLRWTRILEYLEWEVFNSPDARPDDIMVSRR